MHLTEITPNPTALKALTHPVRLRMLGMLRSEGPATATALAARLGINTGATSYHLRQLAQHGFIVDDPDHGNARERWWKAAHASTRLTMVPDDPAARDTHAAYLQSVAVVHTEALQRATEERDLLPKPWQEASTLSDWQLRITPDRARELVDAMQAVVEGWEETPDDAEGAELFVVQMAGFPLPGSVPPEGTEH